MTIVGVDLSTFRVDLAWVDEHRKPHFWHQELGTAKEDAIDRIRRITIQWPYPQRYPGDQNLPNTAGVDVTEVCIEWPWGRGKALPPLMATVGIITRQAPPWARVSWAKCGDLRRAIGATDTKQSAREYLYRLPLWPIGVPTGLLERDEHEVDALVACIGWTRILAAQDAA